MNYNHIPPDIMTKFLTDDLSAEEKQNAELHLAVCPECAAKLDEQRRFEDAAARSYPRTFSGRLDPDCEKAIDDAVRDRLNTPEESPAWKKRIRGAVVIQLGAVLTVALILFAMIITSGKKKAAGPNKVSAATAASAAAPAAKRSKEVTTAPAPSAEVPKADAEGSEAPLVMEPLNTGLIRLFSLNEISLRPGEKETFRQGAVCMDSPFEEGVCILLAVSPEREDPAAERAALQIVPAGTTVLISELSKSGEGDAVSAALFNRKKNDPVFVFARVVSSDEGASDIRIAGKDILKNLEDAPAPLRLAAVMHAAGKPQILLNREIRKKMLNELESLAKNEYADDLRISLFLEKLRKVK